jgi:uncharacterized LabA/DUF88 family protein
MEILERKSKRLCVYLDGFNLYFGMKDSGFDHCKWLDIHALSILLKNDIHIINQVKYFTARVTNNPSKQRRQTLYLDALATTPIKLIYGQYKTEEVECPECFYQHPHSKEKMTDVNIATHMIIDAYKNEYDVALLISGDSDLVPPVREIKANFPNKEILVAFPPRRRSNELHKIANSSFVISKGKLEQCQLPEEVEDKYAFKIKKPVEWIVPAM